MRIGRSLSPGKVFFERDGVLRKVDPEQISKSRSLKKQGFRRVGSMTIQWGVSRSLTVVDDIIFPVPFSREPHVSINLQGAAASIHNITTTGFQIRTRAEEVSWSAFGP